MLGQPSDENPLIRPTAASSSKTLGGGFRALEWRTQSSGMCRVTDDEDRFTPIAPVHSKFHLGLRQGFQKIVPGSLAKIGAPEWLPVIEAWWRRYDGLEVYVGPLIDHRVMGSQKLRDLIATGEPVTAERLAAELVGMRHTHYTARRFHESEFSWNPMQESFECFAEGERLEDRLEIVGARQVEVQELSQPNPSREVLEMWLLSQLVRAQVAQV